MERCSAKLLPCSRKEDRGGGGRGGGGSGGLMSKTPQCQLHDQTNE